MTIFTSEHAKVLYLRFCVIYDHKFAKPYHDNDYKSLWENEWCSGLSGINPHFIKDALEYCKKNVEWPPSIAEFIRICEKFSGIPNLDDCMSLATNREFNHPVILMTYEKVGSWNIKHDTSKALRGKFELAYIDAVNKFRTEQKESWDRLESYNAKPKELPSPSKIPSTGESKAFRECMNKCQEILKGKKIAGGGKTYKEFDEKKIKVGGRDFDPVVHNEWRNYLLSIPETEVMILPPIYAYERMRFIAAKEQPELLRKAGYNPTPQGQNNESSRCHSGPAKVYKNWMTD